MAERTDIICGTCGNKTVLFCDNMFTDFACTSCGATNLLATLPKVETLFPCKNEQQHDIRLAKDNHLFCPKCWTDFSDKK